MHMLQDSVSARDEALTTRFKPYRELFWYDLSHQVEQGRISMGVAGPLWSVIVQRAVFPDGDCQEYLKCQVVSLDAISISRGFYEQFPNNLNTSASLRRITQESSKNGNGILEIDPLSDSFHQPADPHRCSLEL